MVICPVDSAIHATVKKPGPDGELAFSLGRSNSQIPGELYFFRKTNVMGG